MNILWAAEITLTSIVNCPWHLGLFVDQGKKHGGITEPLEATRAVLVKQKLASKVFDHTFLTLLQQHTSLICSFEKIQFHPCWILYQLFTFSRPYVLIIIWKIVTHQVFLLPGISWWFQTIAMLDMDFSILINTSWKKTT